MRPLAGIFHQPALRNFPCFIKGAEQIKIQNLCPVGPVKTFDKRILCWLAWFNKFQCHTMFFCPRRQSQRDEFRAVVHSQFQRIARFATILSNTLTTRCVGILTLRVKYWFTFISIGLCIIQFIK